MDLLVDLKKGKRGAIAKTITIIENDQKEAKKILKKIFKNTGNSIVIGITGPAGAGKSSLINKTVIAMKKLGTKPAVLAIDPHGLSMQKTTISSGVGWTSNPRGCCYFSRLVPKIDSY